MCQVLRESEGMLTLRDEYLQLRSIKWLKPDWQIQFCFQNGESAPDILCGP